MLRTNLNVRIFKKLICSTKTAQRLVSFLRKLKIQQTRSYFDTRMALPIRFQISEVDLRELFIVTPNVFSLESISERRLRRFKKTPIRSHLRF